MQVGTPICIPSRGFIDIGRIASIEINHKQVDVAKKGQQVAIKVRSQCITIEMLGNWLVRPNLFHSYLYRSLAAILKSYRKCTADILTLEMSLSATSQVDL